MNIEFDLDETSQIIAFRNEVLTEAQKQVHESALTCAREYLTAEAQLLEAIIQVDRHRVFEMFGFGHLTPYCVKCLGLSEDIAAYFVRVAKKSHRIPELKNAVLDGRIPVTKAKTIAAILTTENKTKWIALACTLSKDKLEREVARSLPPGKKPERARPSGPDTVRVELEMPVELMELFRRAQVLVSQAQGKAANLVETQEQLLLLFVESKDPIRKAERAEIRKAKQRKSIMPQASATPLKNCIESDRSRDRSRKIPAELIHVLNLRDRGRCQARLPDGSICGEQRWVEHHHIQPLALGGQNTPENMVTLCSAHHRLWHAKESLC